MVLTNREWKEFYITDITEIISGQDIYESERTKGETPYISATANVNGIGYFVGNKNKTLEKNCLSVNRNGSVGYSFYHPYEALFSNDCRKLRLKESNKYVGIFISHIITRQKEKYGYGYKMGTERLKRQKILLPINSKGKPDNAFMENYMKQKETELLEKYENYVLLSEQNIKLNPEIEWKEFLFPEVFEIKNGFYNKKPIASGSGKIPFLGATANNNGVTEYYTLTEIEENSKIGYGKNEPLTQKLFKGNCIAVTNNGSVGYAYYQVSEFTCSHDVNPLYLKNHTLNHFIAKFLITAIEQQRVCFEYARKWRPMRMKKSKILLPANSNGQPDFVYMENYIKALETDKLKQYLEYKKLKTT